MESPSSFHGGWELTPFDIPQHGLQFRNTSSPPLPHDSQVRLKIKHEKFRRQAGGQSVRKRAIQNNENRNWSGLNRWHKKEGKRHASWVCNGMKYYHQLIRWLQCMWPLVQFGNAYFLFRVSKLPISLLTSGSTAVPSLCIAWQRCFPPKVFLISFARFYFSRTFFSLFN